MRTLLLSVLLVGLSVTQGVKVSYEESDDAQIYQDLLDWLASKGADLSPKLQVRRDHLSSNRGVFASTDISEGDLLASIPMEAVIHGDEEPVEGEGVVYCETVKNLIREMQLGNDSDFAPYLRFLQWQSEDQGKLPSQWSKRGRDLLGFVVCEDAGPDQPFNLIDSWQRNCNGQDNDMANNAAMLALRYGHEHLLVPFFDVFNHRNGQSLNALQTPEEKSFTITATRDIPAGEQIYISRNQCPTCDHTIAASSDMLKYYGIVEDYPQHWIVDDPEIEQPEEIIFDIDYKKDGSGELEVIWDDEMRLDNGDVLLLRQVLAQLEGDAQVKRGTRVSAIPQETLSEWNTSWKSKFQKHNPKFEFQYQK